MRIDAEKDFHHHTGAEMLAWLEENWARRRWHGLRRVRVIHGKGEVLPGALRNWCDAKGIPWAPEAGNPGCTILHPSASAPVSRPIGRPRRNRPPAPKRELDPADSALFEQAIGEISDSDARRLLREKHGKS